MQDIIIRIFADGAIIAIVLIGVFALLFKVPKNKRVQVYSEIIIAGLITYLLAKLVGLVFQPADMRPFELLGVSAGASFLNNPGFPSDHTLFATAITCAVWYGTHNKPLTVILIMLTLLVAVGRVLALVHTPLDVIGGIVIGIIGALWYLTDKRSQKNNSLWRK